VGQPERNPLLTRADGLRLVALCAQAEIALVRRDPVAGPLLAQAARAGEGRRAGHALELAAGIARAVDLADRAPGPAACRKVAQALCRLALQEAQAEVLAS
jgi:aryl-alcohol dehydrogenase-like predicted oxidoreductase